VAADPGALGQEGALPSVGGQCRGPLELGCRLAVAAQPVKQVAPHAVEEVVLLERAGAYEDVHQGQGFYRTRCPRDRHGAVELDDRRGCGAGERCVEGDQLVPVGLFGPE
jgi:hypothetical protein